MAISVVCRGCHVRFKVSDKFAGQTGACPKCKAPIQVPALKDEVVVHEPENYGPKNTSGRATLKPISRIETRLSPVVWTGILGACAIVLLTSFVMRFACKNDEGVVVLPQLIKTVAVLVLGPPLVFAGYVFLRDDELEPHRGNSLYARVAVCSIIYAVLWLAYGYITNSLFQGSPQLYELAILVPALVCAGGVASLACMELDFTTGAMHYGFYLFVIVGLSLLAGDPPF